MKSPNWPEEMLITRHKTFTNITSNLHDVTLLPCQWKCKEKLPKTQRKSSECKRRKFCKITSSDSLIKGWEWGDHYLHYFLRWGRLDRLERLMVATDYKDLLGYLLYYKAEDPAFHHCHLCTHLWVLILPQPTLWRQATLVVQC